ncbi:hypothetical protein CEQ90_20505, partial [Lewinellaceae bacterium SD302]
MPAKSLEQCSKMRAFAKACHGRAIATITQWPNHFSKPSKESVSTNTHSDVREQHSPPFFVTLRAGTTRGV